MKLSQFQFNHLGVAVSVIEKAVTLYTTVFGYRVSSDPVFDPIQNVTVCFLDTMDISSPTLELVAPGSISSPVSKKFS